MSRHNLFEVVKQHGVLAQGSDRYLESAGEFDGVYGQWPLPNSRDAHPIAIIRYMIGGGLCTEMDIDVVVYFDKHDKVRRFAEHYGGSAC